jgi:hypothetical protein
MAILWHRISKSEMPGTFEEGTNSNPIFTRRHDGVEEPARLYISRNPNTKGHCDLGCELKAKVILPTNVDITELKPFVREQSRRIVKELQRAASLSRRTATSKELHAAADLVLAELQK